VIYLVKEFPLSPLERIARKAGAERVSSSAIKFLREILLEISYKVATEAIAASKHAKRVTVKREDIRLVTR